MNKRNRFYLPILGYTEIVERKFKIVSSTNYSSFFTERKLHLVRWRGDCSWTPTTNDDAAKKINMNLVNRGIDIYSCEAESLKCHRFRRTIGQSFSALSSRKRMMMIIIIIVVAITIIIIII